MMVWGEVELVEPSSTNTLSLGRNRITKRGLLVLGKMLTQDGTIVSKVRVGTGATPASDEDEGLERPIAIDFPIINKSALQSQDGRLVEARFTSMIESEDDSLSFTFSEAGLFAEFSGQDGNPVEVMVARIVFPPKYKKPFNEYYLTWKIKLALGA